jgi:hypothetical protein
MATYYVRADADGGSDGLTAAADRSWTWAEFITAATSGSLAAGDIVYVVAKGGTISNSSAATPTKDGTLSLPISLLGCYEDAGDLVTTYNADGTLDVTLYPIIEFTSSGRLNAGGTDWWVLRNLYIKADINDRAVSLGGNSAMVACRIEQANTGASACCAVLGTLGDGSDCDFVMTGGSGTDSALTLAGQVTGCRFWGATNRAIGVPGSACTITDCTIFACPGAIGIDYTSSTTSHEPPSVIGCTIVDCTTGIKLSGIAHQRLIHIANNHITGCTTGILSAYDATAQVPAMIVGNRLRNTTNVDGFDPWYTATGGNTNNTVTAGSDAGDYVNAAAHDYRLKANSPGATAGIGGGPAGSAGVLGGEVTVADFTTEARAIMRGAPGTGGGSGVTVAQFTGQALRDVRAR